MVLTSREIASVILIGAAVVVVLAVPKFRAHMAPSIRAVVRAAFVLRLVWLYIVVVIMSVASTGVAWLIGLWDVSLLKDAAIITATVVFPMTFRSLSFKSGGELTHALVRDTFALAALLTVYLDAAPLPLGWEIVYQLAAIFFITIQAFASTKAEFAPAKKVSDVSVFLLGAFLLIWTSASLIQTPPDWSDFFQSLFFGFWLPLSLLPFFYLFGYFAVTETTLARFRAFRKPLSPRVTTAVMIGTRLRLSLLTRLTGRYKAIADATGFRDGLLKMVQFRADLDRRDAEETERLRRLSAGAGATGVDDDGLHRDRREFEVTKKRLDWIWTCQNGQYDRQGGRYWDHLTDLIVDAEKHGLPADHGFLVEISDSGQTWRSWRRTPGGAVLAVGGRERRSMFYFQGDEPPDTWPSGSVGGWRDAAREAWPPDWNHNDGTRL
ncbi:hypothetical protein [Leifsonia sp. A12D58]|uniref:hypothetical protein n=1 Tax=Leifsonia sp. A12D58 TaxID=3397674 RepID=UPI0039E1F041